MQHPETAIIIRTRNEERWIGETLSRLQSQTYKDFEIIIVDSGSTDKTLEISNNYDTQIVQIAASDFTYPYAINVGINASNATKYFVILSAHSLPIGQSWLENGIAKFSLNEKVCGVFGPLRSLPKSTLCDKLIHDTSYLIDYILTFPRNYRIITKGGMGILGFTNAIIRKDLWKQYPINEAFAGGGEDGDWVNYWLQKGYVVVKDFNFGVRHSHNLGLIGWYKQVQHWKVNVTPQEFNRLPYRIDPAHKD